MRTSQKILLQVVQGRHWMQPMGSNGLKDAEMPTQERTSSNLMHSHIQNVDHRQRHLRRIHQGDLKGKILLDDPGDSDPSSDDNRRERGRRNSET
jgi:hypothetical protein